MAFRNPINALLGALALALLFGVAGCSGDSDDTASVVGKLNFVAANRVTGSVGDGPIVGARIRMYSRRGDMFQEFTSSSTAEYDVLIRARGSDYAVIIEADQGTDIVTGTPPDFRLVSGILRPNTRSISNLNPYTTLIFKAALASGGVSDSNVSAMRDAVLNRYGFGLGGGYIADPITTQIDDSNAHVIVKTSETLGEMIRRTRDALPNLDGDAVVAALSADLTDGWIDGRGARGHDARLAAVANVASAAVLVQAMANRLYVNHIDATGAMDNAIRQIRPGAPSHANTANVPIPAEAFSQVRGALRAAALLVDDARIAETIEVMSSAAPGATPADIAPQLPSGIDDVLNSAVSRAATADDTQIAQINTVAREGRAPNSGGGSGGDANAPTITGSPTTALVVGTPWSFLPSASSPRGGALTFSIQGKPAWANFDARTGQLTGTPSSAGNFGPVTISVSDGSGSASLAAFTLRVAQPGGGNATVTWVPPTQRTDGSALTNLRGYKVYYGQNSSSLTHIVDINNVGQTSHYVENLGAGTWYFAVTAYDSAGLESAKSAVRSKTIM
jgi:hypothetical protein